MLIGLDISHRLDPQKTYLAAIDVIHDWALSGWNHVIPSSSALESKVTRGITTTWMSVAEPDQPNQLQIRYLVLGMLHVISQMTSSVLFCESYAHVSIHGVPTGRIEVLVRGKKPGGGRGKFDEVQEKEEEEGEDVVAMKNDNTLKNSSAQSIPDPPKKIVDPKDHDFVILYTLRGDAISPVKFLGTVLYAMANAAQADSAKRCEDFAGFDEKHSMVYRIRGIRTIESRYELTYEDVRKGLKLLASAVYDEGLMEDVYFEFRYEGELLGSGQIERSDFADSMVR